MKSPFDGKEVAFSLDVNQISKPFKTDFGYHIIQLIDRKGEKVNVKEREILFSEDEKR